MTLVPVIMCGGAGSRLWPRSRAATPKQFLRLTGELSLLGATAHRLNSARTNEILDAPVVICGLDQEQAVAEALGSAGQPPRRIIVEPFGRNTGAVAAVAALEAANRDPDALVLLLPSDHYVADEDSFWRHVQAGLVPARDNLLVTFGIEAVRPETGYGYIRRGREMSRGVYEIAAFKEKPAAALAADYVASGEYDWNAGIFLFRASAMISAFEAHAPAILAQCRAALSAARSSGIVLRLDPAAFGDCPSEPVDVAIMEKADRAAVVAPVRMGWSDVGSWDAVAELASSGDRTAELGDQVVAINCQNCHIESDGPLVAAIGLEDLIIVATGDAILISRRGMTQDVKSIVSLLKAKGREDLL